MNKEELISRVSNELGISKIRATAGINKCLEIITEALGSGDKVILRGFGTFKPKQRAARIARSPQTNEEIKIPARTVAVFTAGEELKKIMEEINE